MASAPAKARGRKRSMGAPRSRRRTSRGNANPVEPLRFGAADERAFTQTRTRGGARSRLVVGRGLFALALAVEVLGDALGQLRELAGELAGEGLRRRAELVDHALRLG